MIEVRQPAEGASTASGATASGAGGGQAGEAASAGLAQLFGALLASALLVDAPVPEESEAVAEGVLAGDGDEVAVDEGAVDEDGAAGEVAEEEGEGAGERPLVPLLRARPVAGGVPAKTVHSVDAGRELGGREKDGPRRVEIRPVVRPTEAAVESVLVEGPAVDGAPVARVVLDSAEGQIPAVEPDLAREAAVGRSSAAEVEAEPPHDAEDGEKQVRVAAGRRAPEVVAAGAESTAQKDVIEDNLKPEYSSYIRQINSDLEQSKKISEGVPARSIESAVKPASEGVATALEAPVVPLDEAAVPTESAASELVAPEPVRPEAVVVSERASREEAAGAGSLEARLRQAAPAAPSAKTPLRDGAHEAGEIRVEAGKNAQTAADIQRISTVLPQAVEDVDERAVLQAAAQPQDSSKPNEEKPRRAAEPSQAEKGRTSESPADATATRAKAVPVVLEEAGADNDRQAPRQDPREASEASTAERTRARIARLAAGGDSNLTDQSATAPMSSEVAPAFVPATVATASAPEPEAVKAPPTAGVVPTVGASGGASAPTQSAPTIRDTAHVPEPPMQAEGAQFRRVEAMLEARPNEANRLQLVVHDDQLGRVSVRLVERAGLIDAMLRADRPGTAKQLSDSLSGLTDLLTRGRGLDAGVARMDRSESGASSSDRDSGRESGRDGERQDSSRQEAGRDDAHRRGGQGGRGPGSGSDTQAQALNRRGTRPKFSLESVVQGA